MSLNQFLPSIQLPPLGPIAAPPGTLGALAAAFQVFNTVGRFQSETTSPVPYSKFASEAKLDDPIPSRLGMFLVYLPATLMGIYQYTIGGGENLAAGLLALHFGKRVTEVLFLHRFSGNMSGVMAAVISSYYTFDCWLVSSTALSTAQVSPTFTTIGLILFAIGEAGNFYHHYLLSSLRSNDSRRYVPPTGGLFRLVAAPHYLFELVSWLGVAFCASQLNAFLEVLSHTSYLAGRAANTNAFYRRKFDNQEWPASRKNMVPWIY